MRRNILLFLALFLFCAGLHGQPTNGPVYWSTFRPDCSQLGERSTAVAIRNDAGATIGYSCYITGTFIWFAAGGDWNSYIRVAASGFGAIGADYKFYDNGGNDVSLDSTSGVATARSSGNEFQFALAAHQPVELHLLGATSAAPGYNSTATGTVYATYYCPNAVACLTLKPQLFYSALPRFSWTMAAPIVWDTDAWPQWSAEGIDNGGSQRVSFVVYNQSPTAATFQIRIFDGNGSLAGSGTTPQIPGFQALPGGAYGEAGTYGALLSDVVKTPLPSGVFKILIDGGTVDCAAEVLQFTGASATTLEVAFDTAFGLPAVSAVSQEGVQQSALQKARTKFVRPAPQPRGIFPPITQ